MECKAWRNALLVLSAFVIAWLAWGAAVGVTVGEARVVMYSSFPMWKEAAELPRILEGEDGPWLSVADWGLESGYYDVQTFWMYTEEGATIEIDEDDMVLVDFKMRDKWYTVYEGRFNFKVQSGYGQDQGPKVVKLRFPAGLLSAPGTYRVRVAMNINGELVEIGNSRRAQ